MSSPDQGTFATTRWTLVAAAGNGGSPEAQRALEQLCASYWYPLYAYVRRRGYQVAEAQDLTQAFFAELLEKERLQLADQQRGRFRAFLLSSLNHFLSNQWRNANALKRGGGKQPLSLDFAFGEERYTREPTHDITPERVFERRWAMTLLDNSLAELRAEYAAAGNLELFDELKAHLGGDEHAAAYEAIASKLGSTEGAIKVAAHRLRKRWRELLRAEIAQTVSSPDEIEQELRDLFRAVHTS